MAAKIQLNFGKIGTFGGIFSTIDAFRKAGLSNLIDNTLGDKGINTKYSYSGKKRSMSVHLQIGLSLREHKTAKIMAGKTKDMSQMKQLLLLKKQGVSNRGIARATGMNKETVNNHVRKALGDELDIDGLLGLDDFGMKVLDGQQLLYRLIHTAIRFELRVTA